MTLSNGEFLRSAKLYYDYNKYNICNWDAQLDLDKVVAVIQRHPDIHIALGSHTDSRASDAYNDELSENQIKSATQYMIAKGIEANQVTAGGYSESQLVNPCSDKDRVYRR